MAKRSIPWIQCRNPFQTRSTTSIVRRIYIVAAALSCRNPFQTRSTTSITFNSKKTESQRGVAIPSKPGQRLQYEFIQKRAEAVRKSQSLPNQVNDFNKSIWERWYIFFKLSQSLPNQVNDFNTISRLMTQRPKIVSQSLPNQVNDFNKNRTMANVPCSTSRNPFQTRSTTSMKKVSTAITLEVRVSQSLPNQVNDFNRRGHGI